MKVIDLYQLTRRYNWDTSTSNWQKVTANIWDSVIAPKFGHRDAQTITPKEAKAWHFGLSKTPYMANRALSMLKTMYRVSMEVEPDVVLSNPFASVKHFHEKSRSVYATEEELKRILEVLERKRLEGSLGALYLQVLAHTGARPESIRNMRLTDLEVLSTGEMVYRFKGKRNDEDKVIIPKHLVELLPKTQKIFPIGRQDYLWAAVKEEAKINKNLRIRDLRRTFATIALTNGVPIEYLMEVLNHRNINTTKIYAKLIDSKRVETVNKVSQIITGG